MEGTSLVVRQFMAIVRQDVAVHKPANEFQTEVVETTERKCLKCFTTGVWDVWVGRHEGLSFKLGRCRCCGKEQTL
jgi:hypothetical protein